MVDYRLEDFFSFLKSFSQYTISTKIFILK
jgi:hypothetical protein